MNISQWNFSSLYISESMDLVLCSNLMSHRAFRLTSKKIESHTIAKTFTKALHISLDNVLHWQRQLHCIAIKIAHGVTHCVFLCQSLLCCGCRLNETGSMTGFILLITALFQNLQNETLKAQKPFVWSGFVGDVIGRGIYNFENWPLLADFPQIFTSVNNWVF